MKTYSLRLWPNGEFGMGFYRRMAVEPLPVGTQPKRPQSYSWTASELYSWCIDMVKRGFEPSQILSVLPAIQRKSLEFVDPLGSSNATKTHTTAKRGSKGLTAYGARMLRNGCFMLARRAGTRNCALLTCTLPPMAPEIQKCISANWGEICRVFNQWVHRRLLAAGGCPWLVGCVEIQEKRLDREGGLPLHLHLTFQARTGKEHTINLHEVSRAWMRAVCCCVPMAAYYDFSAATRIEGIKKSVENYLSKYISKGITDNVVRRIAEGYVLPSTWWFGVGGFKKLIKKEMIYDSEVMASAFWRASFKSNPDFIYARVVCSEYDGVEYAVGVTGRIRMSLRNLIACDDHRKEEWIHKALQD